MVIGPVLIATGLATQLPASPFFIGLQDGGYYQQWGYAISESWRAGVPWERSSLWPGKGFWPLLIAVFHFVAGPVLISPVVFNSLLVAFSVVFLQKSTDLLFGVKPTVMFIALTLSSAPILLNGPTLLREGIFWFGISVSVAALAYLYRARYVTAMSLLAFSIILILAIRPNYGTILAYLIAFAALAIWIFQIKPGLTTRALIGASCALVLLLSFPPAFSYLSHDLNTLEAQIETVARGLSSDDVSTSLQASPAVSGFFASPAGASIIRAPSLVVGPFWWEVGPEPVWIAVIASTLHYWFLLTTSTALLFKRANRNVPNLVVFIMSMIILASLTPVMTNYGVIIRFRVGAEILLTPLSAAYIALLTAKTRSRK